MVKQSKVEKTCLNIQANTMFLCDDLSDLQEHFILCILEPLNWLDVDDEEEDVKILKEESQRLAETVLGSIREIFDTIPLIQDKLEVMLRQK